MESYFTPPIVTFHLLATILGQWYFTMVYLFCDTLVLSICSKCKGFNDYPCHVTLSHYINDKLVKLDGHIPPTMAKNLIGDIETTHRNTSICSTFGRWNKNKMFFILNWPTILLILIQLRVILNQSMMSILPKTNLLGDPKRCIS